MGKYIEKASLYNEIARLEELARDRYLDTPFDSPARARYQAQMQERTALKHLIADMKSVEVAPVIKGAWIKPVPGDGENYCSVCRASQPWFCGYGCYEPDYCPNCGAKMTEEENKK